MTGDKRVDDLREDVQELRREMHEGFKSLEAKIKSSGDEISSTSKSQVKRNDKEIDEIRCLLREQEEKMLGIDRKHDEKYKALYELFIEKFNKLDKKLFNLFLIGNGIGIAVGSIATMLIQAIIKNM